MRVVVNRLSILGQKTGVGHYTAELLRCLRQQADPGEIEEYRIVNHALDLWSGL